MNMALDNGFPKSAMTVTMYYLYPRLYLTLAGASDDHWIIRPRLIAVSIAQNISGTHTTLETKEIT